MSERERKNDRKTERTRIIKRKAKILKQTQRRRMRDVRSKTSYNEKTHGRT